MTEPQRGLAIWRPPRAAARMIGGQYCNASIKGGSASHPSSRRHASGGASEGSCTSEEESSSEGGWKAWLLIAAAFSRPAVQLVAGPLYVEALHAADCCRHERFAPRTCMPAACTVNGARVTALHLLALVRRRGRMTAHLSCRSPLDPGQLRPGLDPPRVTPSRTRHPTHSGRL